LEAHSVERKLAAIFAADVAGYSALMGRDEVGTLRTLTASRVIIDRLIASHRGRIFNTAGDSLVADFASAVDAVQCAVAVQEAMTQQNADRPADEQMRFRIGIHVGDIIVQGENLFGDAVNIAARLEALAEPGGICVSGAVRDHIGTKLLVEFIDLGPQQVKNIAQPVRAYRVRGAPSPTGAPVIGPSLLLPEKPSIAVLPFDNLSGDPEQEYFADGMVEEIITALSKVRWFFVIARNSSFTYKGRAIEVKQVGRELGVRYVLEGSVRKGGNRVRVTAQLVDAATGNHVWAERYDRDLADIFAVQDEITEQVVATVEPELYAAEHVRSQRKPPESLDAWECVIRALSYVSQGTLDGNAQAETLCRRALLIAPRYSQARSLLAWVFLRGHRPRLQEALTQSLEALSVDERDAWAHLTHGIALWRMRRHGEAEEAFRRALDFNPNFALAHAFLGCPLTTRGADEEAIRSAERALRLSPLDGLVSAYASFAMVFAHFRAEHYADGVVWARRLIEKQPENLMANYLLVAASAMQKDSTMAAEALARLLRLQQDFSLAWVNSTTPLIREVADRVLEGLRKAGVPE
jgi:TolB-like protein/class 3 adenylate cyclase/Flp pilus assembly protein TadD